MWYELCLVNIYVGHNFALDACDYLAQPNDWRATRQFLLSSTMLTSMSINKKMLTNMENFYGDRMIIVQNENIIFHFYGLFKYLLWCVFGEIYNKNYIIGHEWRMWMWGRWVDMLDMNRKVILVNFRLISIEELFVGDVNDGNRPSFLLIRHTNAYQGNFCINFWLSSEMSSREKDKWA